VFSIVARNSGISSHLFSKLKTEDFGIEVCMEITQGTWSEVVIANGIAMVSGKVVVQATDEKKQSNL
jgi:hypothetical protein